MNGAITASLIAQESRSYHVVAKGLFVGKRGKKRQDGKREPNGQLSRRPEDVAARITEGLDKAEREMISVGISARERVFGADPRTSRDQMAGTHVGRLRLAYDQGDKVGGITEHQYQAAVIWRENAERYNAAMGSPRPPAATSLNSGLRGAMSGKEDEPKSRKAYHRHEAALKAIRLEQDVLHNRANLYAALNLCVERDIALHHLLGDLKLALNVLAHHYRLTGTKRPLARSREPV